MPSHHPVFVNICVLRYTKIKERKEFQKLYINIVSVQVLDFLAFKVKNLPLLVVQDKDNMYGMLFYLLTSLTTPQVEMKQ